MIHLEIVEKNKFLYMPENLGECDNDQYANMAKLIWMAKEQKISRFQLRDLGVYSLLRLRKKNKDWDEKSENLYRFSLIVDNFFEFDEEDNFLNVKLDYIKNHLPNYKLFRKYYGPEDGFNDVNFGQYMDGLEEYIYYTNTGDLNSLRMLFSIFYLPAGEKYNFRTSKKRSLGLFRFVDIRHLYGFYLFFASMQTYVLSGVINVMGNDIDLSLIFESDPNPKFTSDIVGTGMRSVLSELAESQVFGPYAGVEETNMWRVLSRLYELKKKDLDEEKRNKNDTPRA
ncbi:hypothetical protein [Chryseobacterium caseinilyticum]|uniref:Uncharacterized protein n=1 Tax=Chryseobacterium caseinilyticum TaxID=2771428 RepID=A0ABR8Z8N3_9FLAO|nr:hypothetical protein [Chryseobacterium caseinilyticum]MBD8081131.1 hypothetical protein [Chryseobacterium caseinilyticum]